MCIICPELCSFNIFNLECLSFLDEFVYLLNIVYFPQIYLSIVSIYIRVCVHVLHLTYILNCLPNI